MEKLQLTRAPLQVIELGLPDGGTTEIKLKNLTVKQARAVDVEMKKLNKKRIRDEVSSVDVIFATMALICDFDQDALEELDLDHLTEINDSIVSVKEKAREAKKKKS